MWTNVRIAGYLTAIAIAGGTLLSIFGAADFNKTTGMLDVHPINIYNAAALAAPVVTSMVAAVAALFGWGTKK
jgi:hypothetical protein